jgi:dTDP-4-amino-4,6-dideoxygalactose transaminase
VRHRDRDWLQSILKDLGVGTLIHYPIPPHLQKAYSEMDASEGTFPISERIHAEFLSLPMGPTMQLSEAEFVSEKIRTALS